MQTTLVIRSEPTQNVQKVLDLARIELPDYDPYQVRAEGPKRWYDRHNAYARVRLMDGTLILCRHHHQRNYAYMMFTRVFWRPDEGYTIPPRDEFSDQSWRVLWITDPVPGEKLRGALTRSENPGIVQWESTAPVKETL